MIAHQTTALLTVLAVARVTRLITTDYILSAPRRWFVRKAGLQSPLSYLVTCPWCMSIWVGLVGATACWAWQDRAWFQVIVLALTASHLTGLMAKGDDD